MTKQLLARLGWLLLYLVVLATVGLLVWRARERATVRLQTPQAQSEWQAWQDEAERQSDGQGPVIRRKPATTEPPELVLLRDHFATSLAGLLLLTTAIFVTLMTMLRGVFRGPKFTPTEDAEAPLHGSPAKPES